jgi:hypothetical protein
MSFLAFQVKTTTGDYYDKRKLNRKYHILAVVQLVYDETQIYLDRSSIFFIPKNQVKTTSTRIHDLDDKFRITADYVKLLFDQNKKKFQ